MADRLVVRGAREHNLRDVSLDLPRDRLIVFTGLSGSGKSSLAFDTIYAEGQRRYVESLSAYARQFLGQMDKPDVDFIEGLSPAISIDQKSASRNPRSTVGTITEVYDYLRLLYARIGHPHCPTCGRPVARQTPQQIVDRVLELPEGTRFQVMAPVVRGRKGEYSSLLDDLAKQGFARVRVDGVPLELADRAEVALARVRDPHDRGGGGPPHPAGQHPPAADRVDRDGARPDRGTAEVLVMNGRANGDGKSGAAADEAGEAGEAQNDEAITFSQHLACTHCGLSFEEPAPRNFSFNSPYGACPLCAGLGTRFEVDPELVVPDDSLSLAEGALAPWSGRGASETLTGLQQGVAESGASPTTTRGRSSRPRTRSSSSTAPATGPCTSPTRTASTARAATGRALRGHHPVAAAAPRRVRVGLVGARADRAVHPRGGLPRLRRGQAEAGVTGRDRGRAEHLRAVQPLDRGRGR